MQRDWARPVHEEVCHRELAEGFLCWHNRSKVGRRRSVNERVANEVEVDCYAAADNVCIERATNPLLSASRAVAS